MGPVEAKSATGPSEPQTQFHTMLAWTCLTAAPPPVVPLRAHTHVALSTRPTDPSYATDSRCALRVRVFVLVGHCTQAGPTQLDGSASLGDLSAHKPPGITTTVTPHQGCPQRAFVSPQSTTRPMHPSYSKCCAVLHLRCYRHPKALSPKSQGRPIPRILE